MSWRYIATRPDGAGGETVLHWDLPLDDPKISNTLSGPDFISGTIQPEVASLKGPDGKPLLTRWGTCIYAEQDGAIRAGGILTDIRYREAALVLDTIGFAGYPNGIPYLDDIVFRDTDPAAVAAHIWQYVQDQPGGNLGVVTDFAPTPVRTGSVTGNESPQPRDEATGRYEQDNVPKAVELNPASTQDLGSVIDGLASSTPFDYVERHRWDGETIKHTIRSVYPMIGRRRKDLRFVEGENVYVVPDVLELAEDYASEVFVMGAGEGSKQPRSRIARSGETRLRRVAVVSDRSITSVPDARERARLELRARTGSPTITDLQVIDHPHAPLGSYGLGDEVLFQMQDAGWQEDLMQWVRIVQITYSPDKPQQATLAVQTVTGA